jgi:S1-C subfamily serine protease
MVSPPPPTSNRSHVPASRRSRFLTVPFAALAGVIFAAPAMGAVPTIGVAPSVAHVGERIEVQATVPEGSACRLAIKGGEKLLVQTGGSRARGTQWGTRIAAPPSPGSRLLTVSCGTSARDLRAGRVLTSRRGILIRPVVSLAAIQHGVVDIDTALADGRRLASGTGIVLTAAGEIVTNDHVVRGARSITITDVSTGTKYPATMVGNDAADDVAVLQIQGAANLPTVTLGDSSTVGIGDLVTAIGNAGGVGGTPTVASGVVTRLSRTITVGDGDGSSNMLRDVIQSDVDLRSGESGGPLLNAAGKVVGINTAGTTRLVNTQPREGFSIPINRVVGLVRQIEAGRESDTIHIGTTGFLGVYVRRENGLAPGGGVRLARVSPDTPAAAAGLVTGDVVTAIDGVAITTRDQFVKTIQRHHSGDGISLTWNNAAGSSQTAAVTLGEGGPA